jgi:hypothetical protein
MATRKKAKGAKRKTSRRRRVGAMALNAQSPLVMYGSMALGYFLADKINEQVDKFTGTMNGKVVGALEGGAGAALVFMKLGKKKSTVEVGLGGVLIGAGAKRLLREFGIISGIGGYQSLPVLGRKALNGYGSVPVIGNGGGYRTNQQALNGVFNGYEVPKRPSSSSVMGSMGDGSGSGVSCMG